MDKHTGKPYVGLCSIKVKFNSNAGMMLGKQYISPPHVDVPEAKKIEVNAANSVTRILSQF